MSCPERENPMEVQMDGLVVLLLAAILAWLVGGWIGLGLLAALVGAIAYFAE